MVDSSRRDILQLLALLGLASCATPFRPPSREARGPKGFVYLSLADGREHSTIRVYDWDSGESRDLVVPLSLPHSVLQHHRDPDVLYVFESLGSAIRLHVPSGDVVKCDHAKNREFFAGHGTLSANGDLLFCTRSPADSKKGELAARDAKTLELAFLLPEESYGAHQVVRLPGGPLIAWGNMRKRDGSFGGGVSFYDTVTKTIVKTIETPEPILHLQPIANDTVVGLGFPVRPRFEGTYANSSRSNLERTMTSERLPPAPLYRVKTDGSAHSLYDLSRKDVFLSNFGVASAGSRLLTSHIQSNKVVLWMDSKIEKIFDVPSPHNVAVSGDASEFMVMTHGTAERYSLETYEKLGRIETPKPVVSISSWRSYTHI